MNRRTLVIIGSLLLIGIGIAVYLLFFAARGTEPGEQGSEFPSAGESPDTTTSDLIEDAVDASAHPVAVVPRLVKITNGPVALGPVALAATTSSQVAGATTTSVIADTLVRYIERASGNMYEYRASDRTIRRVTSRTIPGALESSWLADGSYAFLRYLTTNDAGEHHIETYALSAKTGEGKMLAEDLIQATGDGASVIMVSSGANGSLAIRSGPEGTNPASLFSSTIARLFVLPSKVGLFAQTPASAQADSFVFSVGTDGALTRVPSGTQGLAALPSPDGKMVLTSFIGTRGIQLETVIVATGERIGLPLSTLIEKCVWAIDSKSAYCGVPTSFGGGTYPDDWYQGVRGFSDKLWEIDFETRLSIRTADLPALAPGTPIDVVGLAIDPASKLLTFMNRHDGSLWAYAL